MNKYLYLMVFIGFFVVTLVGNNGCTIHPVEGEVDESPDTDDSSSEITDRSIPTKDSTLPYTVVEVFYATDRSRSESNAPNEFFGAKRGILSYGTTQVSIPLEHEVGEVERPSWWKFEFRENPEKHIVLLSISQKEKSKYFQALANRISATKEKSAFIFIHGYNVSFDEAARRTAQMAYDLKFDGTPIFYSWPSDSSWIPSLSLRYTTAENNASWTQTHLKGFLKDFVKDTEAENIYLIAHSMGNRVLTKAIKEMVSEQFSMKQFTAIILAAPDIDAEVFKRDIAPKIVDSSQSITLYMSSTDKALQVSKKVHEYPRAGDTTSGIWNDIQGIDMIDASNIDTSFLGHSYYGNSILGDIRSLIIEGKSAMERGLEREQGYWKLK
ncbi:alpha/beta hydrolase [Candidatus Parabeggiatoa sp. HSG14]|uniref:alpha/beta hydrolase n=1 Tax=Candidatus Parabeggiatoa sp. HSG14 TaxID=3055593 RepID=UPI0025A6B53C|nr:alpha/beta hydrolase [Thiotrichales bacterium HSG14]